MIKYLWNEHKLSIMGILISILVIVLNIVSFDWDGVLFGLVLICINIGSIYQNIQNDRINELERKLDTIIKCIEILANKII